MGDGHLPPASQHLAATLPSGMQTYDAEVINAGAIAAMSSPVTVTWGVG